MNFTWRLVVQWGPLFLAGLGQTVLVFAVATPLALFTGAVVALLATVPSRVVRMLCYVYTSLFRNSPLLVQLFFIFYGLPFVGVRLSPFLCGVLGITLNEGAFVAEILRGAIQAIPRRDWEAAASLGLSRFQVLRLVILPQAFRDAVPALTGQASIILKDTSVLSLIMITELTRVAGLLYNRTFNTTGYFVAAGMYIALFLIITWVSRLIELKFRVLR
mgnify:CR=1 FL=1